MQEVKTFTKADNGKLSKVIEYESGAKERFTLSLTEYRKRQEITQQQSVSLVRDRNKMCGLLEI